MFQITNNDILEAAKILLPPGQEFDDERKAVISCLESKDILACPGSGKTTALLAKLCIIAPQLPLADGRGICVLTHTNVAMEEIKKRMGFSSQKLFGYPNFFGTIQSFVDRFLAIPAFINLYGKRDVMIDDDFFENTIERSYPYLEYRAKFWVDKKTEPINYIKGARFSPTDFSIVESVLGNLILKDTNGAAYKGIATFKKKILERGIMCFDDAYTLSLWYLNKFPALTSLFSKRFAFVCIDEMQDTNNLQTAVLDKLFNASVVMQKIGDINQSIYRNGSEQGGWIPSTTNILTINGSKRFSISIANRIKTICEQPQELIGNSSIPNRDQIIIVYDDESIKKVIPHFANHIIDNDLHLLPDCKFSAIGWIGKKHPTEFTIPSYWPNFEKSGTVRSPERKFLYNYLDPISSISAVRLQRAAITAALLKCLRLLGKPDEIKLTTGDSLLKYLKNINPKYEDDLLLKITKWCLLLHKKQSIFREVSEYIQTTFIGYFGVIDITPLLDFLQEQTTNLVADEAEIKSKNICHIVNGDIEVNININTIHGVKGETHTATLYLESSYYGKYDTEYISKYMKGEHVAPSGGRVSQALRMSYVGMSRPAHLLCVSMHKSRVDIQRNELEAAGWHIDDSLCRSINVS